MPTTREIKRRINSVNSTAQITKALQMVSASKMMKAQERAEKAIPYTEGLYDIVNMIGNIEGYESPYLRKVEKVSNIALVLVGQSRGFVGSLSTSMIYTINKAVDELRLKHEGVNIEAVTLYKTGLRIANSLNLKSEYHFAEYVESPTSTDITALLKLLKEGFEQRKFDKIYIAYTHFITTINQEPVVKQLLPLSFETQDQQHPAADFDFEPGIEAVLGTLLPEYFETQLLTAILESIASEHSARMVAMQNATDNALELEDSLSLLYNRTRQSKITAELIDIVSGSSAI